AVKKGDHDLWGSSFLDGLERNVTQALFINFCTNIKKIHDFPLRFYKFTGTQLQAAKKCENKKIPHLPLLTSGDQNAAKTRDFGNKSNVSTERCFYEGFNGTSLKKNGVL
ncbi:unnamed protein product, partial [Owenia fusiformis]